MLRDVQDRPGRTTLHWIGPVACAVTAQFPTSLRSWTSKIDRDGRRYNRRLRPTLHLDKPLEEASFSHYETFSLYFDAGAERRRFDCRGRNIDYFGRLPRSAFV